MKLNSVQLSSANRHSIIDIAKGIGIITVVLCHSWLARENAELSRIVYSFNMPLFFFISGLFFNPNLDFKQLIYKKADGLLKPFFVVVISLFFLNLIFAQKFDIPKNIFAILYATGNTLSWAPLWFLPHLFLVFVSAWILNKLIFSHLNNLFVKYILLLIILLIGILQIQLIWANPVNPFGIVNLDLERHNLIGLPFSLDLTLVSVSFFLAGHFLTKQTLNFKFNIYLATIALLSFLGLHYQFDQTINLSGREYGNTLVCTIQIIAGIYLVFSIAYLCQYVKKLSNLLIYLGASSLFILIFHYEPQRTLTGYLHYYFPENKFLFAVISFVAAIVFSVAIRELTIRSTWLSKLLLPNKN